MTRTELFARIEELIADCLAAEEYTTAGVLATLLGALHAGQDRQLQHVVTAFAMDAILGIESDRN